MPSTLATFSSSEVSLRFREPLFTTGSNRRNALVQPRGIYKGFTLGVSAIGMQVLVNPASFNGVLSESVAIVLADAYTTTSNDLSFSIRRNTAFGVDLSAYSSTTVVLGLFVTHVANSVTGPSTVAEVRSYTLSEFNSLGSQDKLTFVPMGQVAVPTSGLVPATSITPTSRMEAWENIAAGSYPWSLITRNSGFEGANLQGIANTQYMIAHWETVRTAGATSKWSFGVPLTVGNYSVTVNNLGSGDTFSGTLQQRVHIPMVSGQMVRTRLAYKVLSADTTTTATMVVSLAWLLTNGSTSSTSFTLSNSLTGITTMLDQLTVAPIGASELLRATLTLTGYGCASAAGDVVAFEDFQVYAENQTIFRPQRMDDQNSGQRYAHPLILDARDPAPAANAPMFYFDPATPSVGSEGRIVGDRLDQSSGLVPLLHHMGRLKIGDKVSATLTNPLIRAKFDSTQTFPTLIAEFGNTDEGVTATQPSTRYYVTPAGDYVITTNAKATTGTPSVWSKDVTGVAATRTTQESSTGRTRHQTRAAANSTIWTEWDGEFEIDPAIGTLTKIRNSTSGQGTLTLQGQVGAGASAVSVVINNSTFGPLGQGDKLLSVQNLSVEKMAIAASGKLQFPSGTPDASSGQATLVAGSATISTTAVTNSSLIFLTRVSTTGGLIGELTVGNISSLSGFIVTSVQPGTSGTTQSLDTGIFNWFLVN